MVRRTFGVDDGGKDPTPTGNVSMALLGFPLYLFTKFLVHEEIVCIPLVWQQGLIRPSWEIQLVVKLRNQSEIVRYTRTQVGLLTGWGGFEKPA